MSFSLYPRITLVARGTIGIPVTLLIYGTVRLERGLTSITYTSSPRTMNWMLIIPITCSALARRLVYSAIVSFAFSLMVLAGYTEILSPEWIPARSICSMIPGIRISSPSHTASTSISLPIRYLSTRIGCSCAIWLITPIYSSTSSSLTAILMP